MSELPKPCIPTSEQERALRVARVSFSAACPFYAHLFFSEMEEVITTDVPMAATDGRRVYINPVYIQTLKPAEATFVYAHEMDHFVKRHPQRMKKYARDGEVRGIPFDDDQFNVEADYVINSGLMEDGIGLCNPAWLYDPDVTGDELVEDVYARHYKKKPSGGSGNGPGPCPPGGKGGAKGKTLGESGKAPKGAKQDPNAAQNGGGFDGLMEPQTDPVTGKEDVPDESEFKEAIARAASAAKAMGKYPERLKRLVEEILKPQVTWMDHIRMVLTGHMGARHETWNRPNRRRLVLNPLVIMPGRRGFGAEHVAVAIDTSGSIGDKELAAFFAEVGGVLSDIRPKKITVMFCDAAVQRVDEVSNLEELADVRVKGAPGGGGTSFIPPFEYLAKEGIVPETLIYITDMYGSFPSKPPAYPVVWCAITDVAAPWGEVVRIKV